ncbi:PREDICTED: uncharacterized protein LOC109332473 [Lupinus angustifolius]|uniref:uncharacterized protein LOC109332473 n=1 Tax=Lupinus angustifolius TaxID=3871 RepID=UPI00092E20E4|nr:PREDICTED: uncharacterized protein LOC109332473 [Lupinus angustifolius]
MIAARLISPNQRGFIKDRSIQDCICCASEAINLLDHKVFGGNLALKLDITKAFDTLDWKFLADTLTAFGFGGKFISWINSIMHSAKLSVVVNGKSYGYFSCSRGVRQGDPLSPLLFCLAEDVLSRGISNLCEENKISSIKGPRNLCTTSHVLYADDVFIFCRGVKKEITKKEILALKTLFCDYAQVSGQCMNLNKCKFYTHNASATKINNLKDWLGFNRGNLPVNYLGVPLFIGKPRRIHLQPLADRIINKLAAWKGSLLSIMGRVELVRSVIQSMLLYSFHIYAWPAQLLKEIDSSIRNFIWSGDTKTRKIVTVAWAKICIPKKAGGLGLRSIKKIHQASLIKLAWNMLNSNQQWAAFFRERFGTYWSINRYFKSSIWPGIKSNLSIAMNQSVRLIGNGKDTSFWRDNWIGSPIVDLLNIPDHIHPKLISSVADFSANNAWTIPQELFDKFPEVASSICSTKLSNYKDRIFLTDSTNGNLSLKDAYKSIMPSTDSRQWCKLIWSSSIPPSKSFTLWRLINNRMPSDENLQARGCILASKCNLCHVQVESSQHLFLSCSFATAIWDWLNHQFQITIDTSSAANLLLAAKGSAQVQFLITAAVVLAVNTIWHCRNLSRFQDKKLLLPQAINRIKSSLTLAGNSSSAIKLSNYKDRIFWTDSTDGSLSLKNAYKSIMPSTDSRQWCKLIWSSSIPPSKSFTLWRLLNNKMPSDENLQARGCILASKCNLCHVQVESSQHLFLSCSFASAIWDWLNHQFQISIDTSSAANLLLAAKGSAQVQFLITAAVVLAVNTIWHCRNLSRFQDKKLLLPQAINRIKSSLTLADGAARGHPGHAGGGGIFRDHNGLFMGAFLGSHHGMAHNLVRM